MYKSKSRIVLMFVFLSLFVVTVGLILSMRNIDNQNENTTILHTATVDYIDVTNTGDSVYLEIYTKEYRTSLMISTNISWRINIEDVKNLKEGQTIFFRVEKTKANQINEVSFINITSLETETNCIFSLKDYNQIMHASAYPTRMFGSVMALIFLSISIFFYYKIKKTRPNSAG